MSEGKWQIIRLLDVLFLGPFMMLLSVEIVPFVGWWKAVTLMFFGLMTILVNLYFYLKIAGLI